MRSANFIGPGSLILVGVVFGVPLGMAAFAVFFPILKSPWEGIIGSVAGGDGGGAMTLAAAYWAWRGVMSDIAEQRRAANLTFLREEATRQRSRLPALRNAEFVMQRIDIWNSPDEDFLTFATNVRLMVMGEQNAADEFDNDVVDDFIKSIGADIDDNLRARLSGAIHALDFVPYSDELPNGMSSFGSIYTSQESYRAYVHGKWREAMGEFTQIREYLTSEIALGERQVNLVEAEARRIVEDVISGSQNHD